MIKYLSPLAAVLAASAAFGEDALSLPLEMPAAEFRQGTAETPTAGTRADCNGNTIPDDSELLTGATVSYQIDTGATAGFGILYAGGSRMKAMNRFVVQAGGEYLTEMSGVVGNFTAGERISLLAYRDPNNDGLPDDAELLTEATCYVSSNGFNYSVALSPPVYLGEAGDYFFLAYRMKHNSNRIGWIFDNGTGDATESFEEGANDQLHTTTTYMTRSSSIGRKGAFLIRGTGRASVAGLDVNQNGLLDSCDGDPAAPMVRAVNRNNWDAAMTQVDFQVLFTEPVTGVDASDFAYSATGTVANGMPITVTPQGSSGTSYLVSISTLQGVGTLALNVLADGSIVDGDGDPLTVPFSGPTYMVDGRRAEVDSVALLDPPVVTSASPVRFDIEFSRPVHRQGFSAAVYGPTTVALNSVVADAGAPFDTGLDLPSTGTPHASVPTNSLFAGDFTIEAWVYPRTYTSGARIIDFGNGSANGNVVLALTQGTGGLPMLVLYNGATSLGTVVSRRQIPLNAWTHVAATVSGTSALLYVDGVREGQLTLSAPLAAVSRTSNFIGRSNWGSDAYANAVYDEIRIWNVARTREEIVASMDAPIAPSTPNLAAYWRFDENTGLTSSDLTGNGLTATLAGAAWAPESGLGADRFLVTMTPSGSDGPFRLGFQSNTVFTTSDVASLAFANSGAYRFDATAPAVSGVTRRDASPTNAASVSWDVAFSEPVASVAIADAYTTTSATLAGSGPASFTAQTDMRASFNRLSSRVTVPGVVSELLGGEITVEAWVNVRATTNQTLFAARPDIGRSRFLGHVVWGDGRIYWDHGDINVGGRMDLAAPPGFVGSWHHIAFTNSIANSRKRVYIDGVLAASSAAALPFWNATATLSIGGDVGGTVWGGELREFRIWTRELDQTEITAASTAEIRTPQTDLVLALAFDGVEDLGVGIAGANDVRDYSGNGYHGDAGVSGVFLKETETRGVLTANAGDGTAYLAPGITDTDSIVDLAGRPLGGTGIGNGSYADGEAYFVDTDAPATVATGPATKVEGAVSASLAIAEAGVGVDEPGAALYLRETSGTWAPFAATTLTTSTLEFTPPGDGVWHYAVLAPDMLGNASAAPTGQAAAPGEQVTIYNDIANSTFAHTIAAGGARSYTFPMEEPSVNLVLDLPAVSGAGTLTASRTESNGAAAAAGLNPSLLIGESWTIAPSPMPAMAGSAEATFRYDEALLGSVDENGGINAVFAVDGATFTLYTGSDVAVDPAQNLIHVSGINGFSDWYFGAAAASVDNWMVLD